MVGIIFFLIGIMAIYLLTSKGVDKNRQQFIEDVLLIIDMYEKEKEKNNCNF